MSMVFLFVFAIRFLTASGQNELNFIRSYNEHLDPTHALDSMRQMSVTYKLKAKGMLNQRGFEIDDANTCQYFSDGKQKCIHRETGGRMDAFIPPVKIEFENALKTRLNFISVPGDSGTLLFKATNDSVTVMEKRVNSQQKYIYTFDSKTLNLLQIENDFESGIHKFNSCTKYTRYQRVCGVMIPKEAIISFSIINSSTKDFCDATLEYADVHFKH